MADSFYDVLGVSQNASQAEIADAYRKQAMQWHPDKNQGSRESEERFKRIAEAYSALREPQSRNAYDQAVSEGSASGTFQEHRIDPETAAAMFFQEMIKLASELTMQNVKWSRIAEALMQKGCPSAVAESIARGVDSQRKVAVRKSAARALILAIGAIVLGIIATAISYNAAKTSALTRSCTHLLYTGPSMLAWRYFLQRTL